MPDATLTINSRNYGSWSLRGWLLCRFAGLDVHVETVDPNDPSTRDELLLISPSFRVPRLDIDDLAIWDTLAIGEHLAERLPDAGLLPVTQPARALCRSVSGEMHSGFASLRSAMPMNLKARHHHFKVFTGARADIDRIEEIWAQCLELSGGPFLFGDHPSMADAMYAPVCTRLVTYEVDVTATSARYVGHMLNLDEMREWTAAAATEPDEITELDGEF